MGSSHERAHEIGQQFVRRVIMHIAELEREQGVTDFADALSVMGAYSLNALRTGQGRAITDDAVKCIGALLVGFAAEMEDMSQEDFDAGAGICATMLTSSLLICMVHAHTVDAEVGPHTRIETQDIPDPADESHGIGDLSVETLADIVEAMNRADKGNR